MNGTVSSVRCVLAAVGLCRCVSVLVVGCGWVLVSRVTALSRFIIIVKVSVIRSGFRLNRNLVSVVK